MSRAVARHAGGGSSWQLRAPVDGWVERNTLLLVVKAFPLRWAPLVAYRQLGWAWHALRERRLRRAPARRGWRAAAAAARCCASAAGCAARAVVPIEPWCPAGRSRLARATVKPVRPAPRRVSAAARHRRRRDGGLQSQSLQGMLGPGPPPRRPPLGRLQAAPGRLGRWRCRASRSCGGSPPRRGPDAPGRCPHRRRPVALPGLLDQLPPRVSRWCSPVWTAVRRVAASWRILRVALDATVGLLAYRLARREAPERYALLAWLAAAGAMAFPTGPGPNPPALALALGAAAARPPEPARGRRAGRPGDPLPAGDRRWRRSPAWRWRAPRPPRPGRGVALGVGALTLAPFFVVDPAAMVSDTIGFLGIQHLQHLPFPLAFHGPLRPSKLIEFYMPLILVAGIGVWVLAAGLAAVRAGPGSSPTRRRRSAHAVDGSPLRPGGARPGAADGRGRRLPAGPYRRVPPDSPDRRAGGAAGRCRGPRASRRAAIAPLVAARSDRAARAGPAGRAGAAPTRPGRRARARGRRRADQPRRGASADAACWRDVQRPDRARRADLRGRPAPRPGAGRRSAAVRDPRPAQRHPL